MALLFVLLVLLCVYRTSDYGKQGQGCCTDDAKYFHECFLYYCWFSKLALAQASRCRVDRVADCFAGHDKLNSSVLLSSCGVIVGSYS